MQFSLSSLLPVAPFTAKFMQVCRGSPWVRVWGGYVDRNSVPTAALSFWALISRSVWLSVQFWTPLAAEPPPDSNPTPNIGSHHKAGLTLSPLTCFLAPPLVGENRGKVGMVTGFPQFYMQNCKECKHKTLDCPTIFHKSLQITPLLFMQFIKKCI